MNASTLKVSFGAAVALCGVLGGALAWNLAAVATHAPAPSAVVVPRAMGPQTVDPTWIKSGTPRFTTTETLNVPAQGLSTGLWACEGPAVFDWTFGSDETVHILEGAVDVRYNGHLLKLRPGDTAFFRAGTTAEWSVPERVYKTYVLQDPGRLGRLYRRITGL
jgi:uncharacterized cupin superfamily protein